MRIALLVSVLGYYLYWIDSISKDAALFPVSIISWITIVSYVLSLMSLLHVAWMVIVGIGWLLLFFMVFVDRQSFAQDIKTGLGNPVVLFMGLGIAWCFFITRGVKPSQWDDFSHWYRICKMMNYENALPTTPDMRYPSYVPGTSLYIFFITRFISFRPDNCYFAQSLFNLSCCAALFSGLPERPDGKLSCAAVISVCTQSAILCGITVSTYSLLVDTLVSLVSLTALLAGLSDNVATRWQTVLIALLLTLSALIKISAMLFVGTIGGLLFVRTIRSTNSRRLAATNCAAECVPAVAAVLIWQLHARIAFGSIGSTGQGISITRYAGIFGSHTAAEVSGIVCNYLKNLFLASQGIMQVRLLWLCALMIVAILVTLGSKRTQPFWANCLNQASFDSEDLGLVAKHLLLTMCLYLGFLMVVYVCSMNPSEANSQHLACLFRYLGTIAIYCCGVLFYVGFRVATRMRHDQPSALLLISVVLFFVLTMYVDIGYVFGFDYYNPDEYMTQRAWELLEQSGPENVSYTEDSYTIIYDPGEMDAYPGKLRYAAETYYRSSDVRCISKEQLEGGTLSEDDQERLQESDWVIYLY